MRAGGLLAGRIYGGIYSDRMAGRFFSGYYMADFIGVNGGFFEKVYKST